MKKASFLALILFAIAAKSQSVLPANIDIHKNIMTIVNHNNNNTCGFLVDSSGIRDPEGNDTKGNEDLIAVMKKTGGYNLGSGFVYEYGGEKYVITCEHVIFKSEKIVGYDTNYEPYQLELVGGDTFYDVAVLRFKNQSDAARWRGVRFDFTPQKDTEVYAAGYWKVNGDRSMGHGNLLSENTDLLDKQLLTVKIGFIKSDAPTDSGYSGGALYNIEGQVIGMNNSVHTYEQTSFALQSKIIKRIVDDILHQSLPELQRAFLGIQFSQNISGGAVVINKILNNTSATNYRAQLEGKTLVSINGRRINDIYDVLKIMENIRAGETLTLAFDTGKKIALATELLNDTHRETIALHAVRQHEGDECVDIRIIDGIVTITTNKQNKEVAKTAGLSNDRVYCLSGLAQLGTLVRIFSLHGELRIGIDDKFDRGKLIWFSDDYDMRILYY